jgi:hypothetical protein
MAKAFKHLTSYYREITQKTEKNQGTAITGNPSFNLQERSVSLLDINQVTFRVSQRTQQTDKEKTAFACYNMYSQS